VHVPRDENTEAEKAARQRRFLTHVDLAERTAHFGYWIANLETGTQFWSPGMYRLIGDELAAQIPDSEWLLSLMPPDDAVVVRSAITTAILNGAPFSYRCRARNMSGDLRTIDTHGESDVAEDGRTIRLLGVCHDVTEKVRAEEARARAQEMYRVMASEASDIILMFTPDRKIEFVSDALERVLGCSPAEIELGNWRNLLHPDDVDRLSNVPLPPKPGETLTHTYRLKHRDGNYVWLETVTRGRYAEDGTHLGIVSVARDITLRKQHETEVRASQARAEAANKAKSRFLANMSHELRTPLNAIIGFADMMRQGTFGPIGNERYEEYSTLIHDSGQLLLDLISDILDMSKIEAGKMELNFENVDLTGTIKDALRLLHDRARKGNVTLEADPANGAVALEGDRRSIKQILINLATNAVKFTPPGGHVLVSARIVDGAAVITVRDNGIGIPESEIHRLGKPFEQVCADPLLAKAGTGLGLALVRALAEGHGGTLTIASDEGFGTEVYVSLPLSQAKRQAA
jgi:PAS domain S-box-containing protein